MKMIFEMMQRLDRSWLGDLIGAACLFLGGYALWFIGCVAGL